ATYKWSIAGGTILAGGDTASVTWNAAAAGTVYLSVVVTNAAGARASGSTDVQALAEPDFTVMVDHQWASAGEELGASVNPAPGVTYNWTTPDTLGATILSGQGTSQVRVRFANAGEANVYCTETNAAGASKQVNGGFHVYAVLYRVTNNDDAGPGSLRDAL